MSLGIIGIDTTSVSTTPLFAVGVRGAVEDQSTGSGVKEYIYVSLATSTAFTVGQAVAISGAGLATPLTVTNSAPGQAVGRRVGIVVAAASSSASAQYAWVQIFGVGAVLAGTLAVLNTILNTTATAGLLDDDATAGAEVIDGLVLNATVGGANAVTACVLNYPFVGRTL